MANDERRLRTALPWGGSGHQAPAGRKFSRRATRWVCHLPPGSTAEYLILSSIAIPSTCTGHQLTPDPRKRGLRPLARQAVKEVDHEGPGTRFAVLRPALAGSWINER